MSKVILISGGSDGLGKETARLLAKDNTVVILAPNPEKTAAAAKEIGCEFEICDITKWDQIEVSVKNVITKHGKIDVLINNAGVWIEGPLETNDPQAIHKVLEVNTLGTFWLTRATIPHLLEQKAGLILNVISQGGLVAKADRSIYYSSKWAITGFTKCLELELVPKGIKVVGVYPDKMNTQIFAKTGSNKDLSNARDPKEVAQIIANVVTNPEASPTQIEFT